MNYHTDEDGTSDFNQNVAAGVTAEEKVAAYYRSKGFYVTNQGTSKKTDLLMTKQSGQTALFEVKDNWKDETETTVVIENNSVREGKEQWKNDGWIYTSKCKYIGFVNSKSNKMLMFDFKKLQAAFKQVILMPLEGEPDMFIYNHNKTTSQKDGRVWDSSYMTVLLEDLKRFGAVPQVIELTITTVPVAVPVVESEATEIIDDHVADTTKFHDERTDWLAKLHDGFLDDKSVKSMLNKFD